MCASPGRAILVAPVDPLQITWRESRFDVSVLSLSVGAFALGVFLGHNALGGERVLTFVPAISPAGEPLTMRDEQTASLWSGLEGVAFEGVLKGQRLVQVPATYAFWFAWKDYYPQTAGYGDEGAIRPKGAGN